MNSQNRSSKATVPNKKDLRARLVRGLASIVGSNSSLPSVRDLEKADTVSPKQTPFEHAQWEKKFESTELLYPNARHLHVRPENATYTITYVDKSGLVAGTYSDTKERFNVFARANGQSVPAGCSCELSNGEYPCPHSFFFVKYLRTQLVLSNSQLSERVNRGSFDTGSLDMSQFKFDSSLRVLAMLDQIASSTLTKSEFHSAEELPTTTSREPNRLVWNVCLHTTYIIIECILQTPLKKGGYGKGKRISRTALFKGNIKFSPTDLKIRDSLKFESNYYENTYEMNEGEVLFLLIGAQNVQLNGQPAIVSHSDSVIRLEKRSEHYRFRIGDETGAELNHMIIQGYLVAFNQPSNRIFVRKLSNQETELIPQLLKAAPVSLAHEEAIVQRIRKLQSLVSIELPESIGGSKVPNHVSPVMILRSCQDGALDYGIRVRDSNQKLFRPGEGTLIHPREQDSKTVQWIRQPATERHLLSRLQQELGIDPFSCEGQIPEFEESLQFVERLQNLDMEVEVLWDKTSQTPLKMLGTVTASNVRVGITQKRDWFNLTGECNLGDQSLDIVTLLQGLRESVQTDVRGDFVRVGDLGWARISEELRKSLKTLDDSINQERGSLRFDQTSAHALREIQRHIQVDAGKAWNECLSRLERAEKLEPTLPTGLKASLRDYQVEGFKWLRRLAEWGVGGVLADDMGLGKTVQTLAAILDRSEHGPTLVIAPTSVCFNWMREIEKFAPELSATMFRETDRSDFLENIGPMQVCVCSYGLALRDQAQLAKVKWTSMVLDEAQAIKNSRSKTSLAISTIPSQWTVALTGTPVENHLGELWSLFHIVSPGVLGGWEQFRSRFAVPIEKENDDDRRMALKHRLTPFILRRTKSEVLNDLPSRTEMNLYVELSPAERAVYDQVRMSSIGEVDALAKLSNDKDQRFRVLALLTRLRQLACHPGMVHESWNQGSAKLNQLKETVLQLREEGHRVLVFSQFVKHLALIRELFDTEKISYQYLDGQTPAAERQTEVDKFQNGDATAFLISLKAGGTGLNLTAADYVIHMDPWWNPAVEDQATDRAHRIGQQKPVMVYRIVAQNTIEEEILKLHDTKRDLVAGILDGTHSAGKLSTEDLIKLLRS